MERKLPQSDVDTLVDDLIVPFYSVKRDMLVPPEFKRLENDAEHSWSVTVLACSLAEHIDPELDVGLIAQFGIVHDLVELPDGDTSVWADDSELEQKDGREAAALELIKTKFANFTWLVEILEQYERLDTKEAMFVRAVDKYIALMIRFRDGGKFFRSQSVTKAIFEHKLEVHRRKARLHPGVGEYYDLVRQEYDSHPEYFYEG